jgi:hypothetical protein
MSAAPVVFGFSAWIKLNKRTAKKRMTREWEIDRYSFYGGDKNPVARRAYRVRVLSGMLSNFRVGDLIKNCTGLNARITAIEPLYIPVGAGKGKARRKGQVLTETLIKTPVGTCFLFHCDVGPPVTQGQAEELRERVLKLETERGDPCGYGRWCSHEVLTIHSDGTYTVDQDALDALEAADGAPNTRHPLFSSSERFIHSAG